ncbi:Cna B-type domain-containing protein [Berryella wangjianweii]|uniref:Cna B-type domain-containing protein n=1 Tax=Berryella wangjianweii TaxID=2734634 RepID=A0A6M8IZU6_9ACTN|nr:Cna B-type domain-containing protein [Berryella wangjianweii]QKF06837.1 Cna B-type domain-containing protein [Berryella wangjianweii]
MHSIQRTALRSMALALAAVLAALALTLAPACPACAADRAEVDLSERPGAGELQGAIDRAGSVPTRIALAPGDCELAGTLVIPSGADVELVGSAGGGGRGPGSRLARGDGFAGVMVLVERGARLTLGRGAAEGALEVNSRGESVPAGEPTLLVLGEATVDHAVIQGARGVSGSCQAAVTVRGAGALLTMNGGLITDNRRLADPTRAQYGAGNVAVTDGARFVMNGGEVSRGRGSAVSARAYGEAGGISLVDGASFEMNGGSVVDNEGFAGGVMAQSWVYGSDIKRWLSAGVAERMSTESRVTAAINGGLIAGNRAAFGGGGLMVWGNAVATMSGGSVERNVAPSGGGVCAVNLYTHGDDYHREVPGEGLASGLSIEEYSRYQPGAFSMRGGAVRDNVAHRTGGGVNVVSNGVELEGGEVSGNRAGSQGGGVYVASPSYTARLRDAAVYDNRATAGREGGTGVGGGVWTCPTGRVTLHVTRGAAICGNSADSAGDDFAHTSYGGVGAQVMSLADRVLGGGAVSYHWDDAGARFDPADPGEPVVLRGRPGDVITDRGLRSVVAEQGAELARAQARLRVFGNSSPRGGGIGTNGGVEFGEPGEVGLSVTKEWAYRGTGEPVPADRQPDSVEAVVTVSFGGRPYLVERVTLRKSEGWSRSLTGLPSRGPDGSEPEVGVREVGPDGGLTVSAAPDPADPRSLRLVNEVEPPVDVTASKRWVGGEALGPRPTVWLRLYRALPNAAPEPVPGAGVAELADGVVTATWRGLARADASGRPYSFTVREVGPDGSDFVPAGYEKSEEGLTVTNSYTPPEEPPAPPEEPPAPPEEPPAAPPAPPEEPPAAPPAPPSEMPATGDAALLCVAGATLGLAAVAFWGAARARRARR